LKEDQLLYNQVSKLNQIKLAQIMKDKTIDREIQIAQDQQE